MTQHPIASPVYCSQAVLADDSVSPPEQIVVYKESTAAGVRLPHAWLLNVQGKHVSTRDLANGQFVLLVQRHAELWRATIKNYQAKTGLPLKLVAVGADGSYKPVDEKFSQRFNFEAENALLVRPDGYIGARFKVDGDMCAKIRHVLNKLLQNAHTEQQGDKGTERLAA